MGDNHQNQRLKYATETISIELKPNSATEYKAMMREGAALIYSWTASSELYTDFHAHLPEGNPDFYTRYSEGRYDQGHGSIIAPYSGHHGWYWENTSDQSIQIELSVAGFYDQLAEFKIGSDN